MGAVVARPYPSQDKMVRPPRLLLSKSSEQVNSYEAVDLFVDWEEAGGRGAACSCKSLCSRKLRT